MIVYSTDGRIIGTIEGGIYFKSVSARLHQLRRPPAWAVDAAAFDKDIAPHCRGIVITDLDSGKRYSTSIVAFLSRRISLNRGFGKQYALALRWWDELAPGQTVLPGVLSSGVRGVQP